MSRVFQDMSSGRCGSTRGLADLCGADVPSTRIGILHLTVVLKAFRLSTPAHVGRAIRLSPGFSSPVVASEGRIPQPRKVTQS
jgi:hypothetical protein